MWRLWGRDEVLGPGSCSACPLLTHTRPSCVSGVGFSKLHDPAACQFLHPRNGERIPHVSQMGVICNTEREP